MGRVRWCRSFLAQPPANGCEPFGFVRGCALRPGEGAPNVISALMITTFSFLLPQDDRGETALPLRAAGDRTLLRSEQDSRHLQLLVCSVVRVRSVVYGTDFSVYAISVVGTGWHLRPISMQPSGLQEVTIRFSRRHNHKMFVMAPGSWCRSERHARGSAAGALYPANMAPYTPGATDRRW